MRDADTMGRPLAAGGITGPMLVAGGIDIATADARYLKKNVVQVAATDALLLGAIPPASGAMRIDAASFANSVMYTKNVTSEFGLFTTATETVLRTLSTHALFLGSNNLNKWRIPSEAAGTSTFLSVETTARLVGGSLNGWSLRNSSNVRDNLLLSDAGNSAIMSDGTRSGGLTLGAQGANEFPANGVIYISSPLATMFSGVYTGSQAGSYAGILYRDTTAGIVRSAAEVAVVAGFGTLDLMKSGGDVRIGRNAAYGAGVASLRLDGLTNGAGAAVGTLNNSPAAGDPTFWIPVNVAGVVKYIPAW